MVKQYKKIIEKYFEDNSIVEFNIKSFDDFLDKELQKLVDEIGEIVPTIIPQEFENFRIKLSKITVGKPEITEADGSKRALYPMEARLRNLTYAAPIYLEISAYINDTHQRESFKSLVGKMPIMVKSKHCHLNGLKDDELMRHGEDPTDPGGYFVLNGNERVLITVEDLASNKLFVKESDVAGKEFTGKVYSERLGYRIPHTINQNKEGIITLSFARFSQIPFVAILKALGMTKDQEIMTSISDNKFNDDILVNLYDSIEIKTQQDALLYLGKQLGTAQKENFEERILEQLDKYFLPHVGLTSKDRTNKAYNICKLIRRYLMIAKGIVKDVDQDHYMNKRLKLSGDLLTDLFRYNLRSLVQDILYNFQRLVKRGKYTSLKIIIREQLLTSRIKSAMATGSWSSGRVGISQNMARTNFNDTMSHLTRVNSLLTSTQENFEARALHSTHWGRLCPVETTEGQPIGLRKNLAMLAKVTNDDVSDEKTKKILAGAGLKPLA